MEGVLDTLRDSRGEEGMAAEEYYYQFHQSNNGLQIRVAKDGPVQALILWDEIRRHL